MRRAGLLGLVAAISVASVALGFAGRLTVAVLGDQESAAASYATAACFADDPSGPTVSASVISKTTPYLGGAIREGMAYYVYANVTPGGAPVGRVSADVRSLTGGEFLTPLAAGSYSVGGVAYGWRSSALAAASPLAPGPYAYTVTAGDTASRCRTAGASVTVDHTAPYATDVQPINNGGGGGSGRPEAGDTIVYTFSERIDPQSVAAGWTGASANVVVRISDAGANDVLTVWDATNAIQLPFGSVALGENYVTANTTFGASGTASTMVQSGTSITVMLGTPSATAQRILANATGVWTPSAGATDAATNPCSTAPATESGAADRNF